MQHFPDSCFYPFMAWLPTLPHLPGPLPEPRLPLTSHACLSCGRQALRRIPDKSLFLVWFGWTAAYYFDSASSFQYCLLLCLLTDQSHPHAAASCLGLHGSGPVTGVVVLAASCFKCIRFKDGSFLTAQSLNCDDCIYAPEKDLVPFQVQSCVNAIAFPGEKTVE